MSAGPKQDPVEKGKRALASDGRVYFSYAQIAEAVSSTVPAVKAFAPDVFVAIGGGGFIPARMLRTEVKVPIIAISLELYDDATKTANDKVLRKQWFDETPGTFGALVRGRRVLIVDEVDDTRTTLQFAVEELRRTNAPAAVGVLVVHNKLKPKKGVLPDDVTYIAGEDVANAWNCYPWDARAYGRDIWEHEELARQCAGDHAHVVGAAKLTAAALVGAAAAVACFLLMTAPRRA
jgi:hypoxanthine phosphoribosyltransferase